MNENRCGSGSLDRPPPRPRDTSGGWLFVGILVGAAIVGCCWLLSLRTLREAPAPAASPAPEISCDCGTVTLVNPQDWARVLFDPGGVTSADGELVTLERLP